MKQGYSPGVTDVAPQDPNSIRDPHKLYQQEYDGPYPDKVLRVTLGNKGKTAALDISGQLYFDSTYLRPLDFPDLDANVEDEGEGTNKVDLYTSEGSWFLPAPTDERLTFDVAVLVKELWHYPNQVRIRYSSRRQHRGHWLLDIQAT